LLFEKSDRRGKGEPWVSHLPKAQKQLEKVKGYMEKASAKLIKSNKDSGVKSMLSDFKWKFPEAVAPMN
jgi:hypothetical protein